VAILPTKLVSVTFLPKIFFVIIVGKKDIKKLFVLPSFEYNDKICQHLLLPLNQNPRHLSLPFMLSPPKVIPVRMLRRRNTMLTRGSASTHVAQVKILPLNLNH
jgi:hypothetical protein